MRVTIDASADDMILAVRAAKKLAENPAAEESLICFEGGAEILCQAYEAWLFGPAGGPTSEWRRQDPSRRTMQMIHPATIIVAIGLCLFIAGFGLALDTNKSPVTCTFDRNEPRQGEVGDGLDGKPVDGWWWDIYKCSDGTERRVLVAGARG